MLIFFSKCERLEKYDEIEGIVKSTIKNNINIFLLQENWTIGNMKHNLRGHATFYHGLNKASSRRG